MIKITVEPEHFVVGYYHEDSETYFETESEFLSAAIIDLGEQLQENGY